MNIRDFLIWETPMVSLGKRSANDGLPISKIPGGIFFAQTEIWLVTSGSNMFQPGKKGSYRNMPWLNMGPPNIR